VHSTNYYHAFIGVAEDCPVRSAEEPPRGNDGTQTVASLQFELIAGHPYRYTSDDVLFHVHKIRNDIASSDTKRARDEFFSKGQACLRSSPLAKRYEWGIHSDSNGKVAIYGVDSDDYRRLAGDKGIKQLKAMRSKRA
jgi:hypothetical protein